MFVATVYEENDMSEIVSVHKVRFMARRKERELQERIEVAAGIGGKVLDQELRAVGLPPWTRGVKVEKAGAFQFAVVATRNEGH